MRLGKLSIHRYRAISGCTIDLSELTVLVGPNGAGKSTVLRALEFLCRGAEAGELQSVNGQPALNQLLCLYGPPQVSAELVIDAADVLALGQAMGVKIGGDAGWGGCTCNAKRNFNPADWTKCPLEFSWTEKEKQMLGTHLKAFEESLDARLRNFFLLVKAERILGSENLSGQRQVPADGRTLKHRMYMKDVDQSAGMSDEFDRLTREVLGIFPDIRGMKVIQRNGHQDFLFDRYNSDWMGSGLREVTVIAGEILQANEGLVAIEEPERGLHPELQRRVVSYLRDASRNKQLLITTHSPAVVGSVPLAALWRVSAAHAVKKVEVTGVGDVVRDLGISFSDSLSHKLILLVEGDDDEAAWNSWFSLNNLSSDCLAIDTRGFTNVKFYAESDFLRALKARPVVWTSLDGDTKNKREGPQAQAHAERMAKEFGGDCFVLQRECIDDYFLDTDVLARCSGQPKPVVEAEIAKLDAEWAERKKKGVPIDVRGKWVLDRVCRNVFIQNPTPVWIGKLAAQMRKEEVPTEVQNLLERMRESTARASAK